MPASRRIVGFHKDELGDWVADLECGHSQHVRHNPPWESRPWVIHEESRAERIGMELQCVLCAPPTAVARSSLVTFMAWIAIIAGALGMLATAPAAVARPSMAILMLLFDSACSVIAGFGLRARREWARRGFIFVLAYSAIIGVVGAFRVRSLSVTRFPNAPSLTQEQLDAMMAQVRPIGIGAAIISAIVSAFLIVKLTAPDIVAEFD